MSGLTLSAVFFLCLEQVGGGNRVMMWPWYAENFLRGRFLMLQESIKNGWLCNFTGVVVLLAPLLFYFWIVEVPLL